MTHYEESSWDCTYQDEYSNDFRTRGGGLSALSALIETSCRGPMGHFAPRFLINSRLGALTAVLSWHGDCNYNSHEERNHDPGAGTTRFRSHSTFYAAIDAAGRLSSPFVVATPPRAACPVKQITLRYKDLLQIGRQVAVKPVMEYISFFRPVSKLDHAWDIVQATHDDDATIIPDAFHTWNSHSSLEGWQQIPVERIAHHHFNDAPDHKPRGSQTDPDRVMPGDGVIDLDAEVEMLREKGYADRNGTVSLELFNRDLWTKDPNDVLKVGMERMQHYFGDD